MKTKNHGENLLSFLVRKKLNLSTHNSLDFLSIREALRYGNIDRNVTHRFIQSCIWVALATLLSFSVVGLSFAQSEDYDSEKEAAERIKRQLELANELRENRLKKQREKENQLQHEEKTQQRCNKLKDELRRLSERRRWYKLDESGERVYMSEKEVNATRKSIQKEYDSRCED